MITGVLAGLLASMLTGLFALGAHFGESLVVRYMNLEEQVDSDFSRARRRALLRRMRARLMNDPDSNRLFSFDEVRKALGADNRIYLGRRVVPVEKIVGSVGRYSDFDRAFLPTKRSSETRWKRIDRAFHRGEDLPPVSLYKIGEVYFVQDGNHRVSVARYQGIEMIEAEVVELRPPKQPAAPDGRDGSFPPLRCLHTRTDRKRVAQK